MSNVVRSNQALNDLANGKELAINWDFNIGISGWSTDANKWEVSSGTATNAGAYGNIINTTKLIVGRNYEITVNVSVIGSGVNILDGSGVLVTGVLGENKVQFIAAGTLLGVGGSGGSAVGDISVKEIPQVQGENLPDYVASRLGVIATNNFIHIQDQKVSGSAPQSISSGWNTRELNTILTNTISLASLSSNQFTLAPGKYFIEGLSTAMMVNANKNALYNVTDTSYDIIGINQFTRKNEDVYDAMATTNASFSGIVEITSTKVFELRHYIQSDYNFGSATNISGIVEVYSDIKIWKVG